LGDHAEPASHGLRRLAGDTGVYALATAAGPLAALLAVPVLTRELGPAGFGTVDLLLSLTALAGVIAVMGMDAAAARSWFEEGRAGDRHPAVIGTAVRAVAAASCALAAVLALVVAGLGAAGAGLGVAAALAAFLTFPVISTQAMLREAFRLEGRRGWYVAVAATSAVLGAGAAVTLVVAAGMGPTGYFLGLGAGALVALVLAALGSPTTLRAPLDRPELRVMLRFGLPLVPASIAMWTLLLADRAIVGAFRGVDEVGLYGLGNRVAAPLFLAVQAFQVAWVPFALRVHRDAPAQEPVTRGRAATLVLAVATAAAVPLVAFASPLVEALGASIARSAPCSRSRSPGWRTRPRWWASCRSASPAAAATWPRSPG
jgi:O-antigen/teichoic acid export membrane protein